jgi:toxin HigB-1
MIKSFGNRATEKLFRAGKSKFPGGLDTRRALVLMKMLDAAPNLEAISPLKSMGLHALSGDRKGFWAITVNGPWRIVFQFDGVDWHLVEIVDYH